MSLSATEQLKRLEARVGKEIHWSLLAYMIEARETLELTGRRDEAPHA
jgi:hypothetical protein